MNVKEILLKKRCQVISVIIILMVFLLVVAAFLHRMRAEFESLRLMAQHDDDNHYESMLESLKYELNEAMDKLEELSENTKEMNQKYEEDIASLHAKVDALNDQISKLTMVNSELLIQTSEMNESKNKKDIGRKEDVNTASTNTVSEPTPTTIPTPKPTQEPTPKPTSIPSGLVKEGQSFTVTIFAESISDLYGYQFNLIYDKTKATYQSDLRSLVNEIDTIFYKDMPDYMLIGATMIGTKSGANGKNISVCSMTFTANEDYDLSTLGMERVNIVTSSQSYVENVSGWSIQVGVIP